MINCFRLGIVLFCAAGVGQAALAQNAAGSQKMTPAQAFRHACQYGNLDKVKKALEAYPDGIAEANRENVVILREAAIENKIEMAKFLIEKGADPNVLDEYVRSALSYAAEDSAVEVAALLLANGAHVDIKSKSGSYLPLHYAAARNHFKIVQLILDHVAKDKAALQEQLTAKDRYGATALHRCFEFEKMGPQTALLLIEAGAPLSVEEQGGETPIHLAATRNLPTVVAKLIEKGVPVDLPNRDKETALYKAVEVGATETVKVLLEKGAKVEDRIMKLAEAKDNNAVIELLDQVRAKAKK